MLYTEFEIKQTYRTPDNIVDEFYTPLLSNAVSYDRAVGFFSSSVLLELSKGLINLIYNNGKMRLITSPRLKEDDINAIERGYSERDVINNVLLRDWKEPKNNNDVERLNFLANLISDGYLDIKIAFKRYGLYHEKIGILTDREGNSIAFTGSLNESAQAMNLNFESIDTFTSWHEPERVKIKKQYFENTWSNLESALEVIEFPKVLKEKLESYKTTGFDEACKIIEQIETSEKRGNIKNSHFAQITDKYIKPETIDEIKPNTPKIPELNENFHGLHDYQNDAINTWTEKGYRGIFDMATGTGKTFTGLGAITRLYNDLGGRLGVVICCPQIHLVDQWVEDIEKFNIEPIIGYGNSPQMNWKIRLKDAVSIFTRTKGPKFFCFISTNDTFKSKDVQEQIKKLGKNCLFVVDEAHNFGAESSSKVLPDFEYRLALSATLDRHGDAVGTKCLYDYFGEKCIEYTLARAIKEEKLTKYYYYPHIITLTADELEEYRKISLELKKYYTPDGITMCEAAKKKLIKRARILASAKNKISKLRELMVDARDKYNLLIYCGDSVVSEAEYNDSIVFGEKQISLVCKILGFEMNMDIKKFTSQETREERQKIKEGFINKDYQAIVAIKCLDEGVNIPSIETAYILASTTNPKQYIQRRGRVLRKFPGKEFSYIHDFIVLPCEIESLYNYSNEEFKIESGLIKRELKRMIEFAELAENSSTLYREYIDPLSELFNLSENSNIQEETIV